jgi:hypothetical protein
MDPNRRTARRLGAVLPLALLALLPAAGGGGDERRPGPAPLAVEAVLVGPEKPTAASLLTLSVRLANRGPRPVSRLRWRVSVAGRPLESYRDRLDLALVPPGGAVELPLYNFWASESGRPAPADGVLEVVVEVVAAQWVVVAERDGVPVETPTGAVPGLPVQGTARVRLGPAAAR